jgi:hypothetical protein
MPNKIEPAVCEQVLRMVADPRSDYATPDGVGEGGRDSGTAWGGDGAPLDRVSLDEMIISLYAGGMTVRDIQHHSSPRTAP